MEPEVSISSFLKCKRREVHMSVKDVLAALNERVVEISDKTLCGWESGHRQPDADTFLLLCQIYNVDSFQDVVKASRPEPIPWTIIKNSKYYAEHLELIDPIHVLFEDPALMNCLNSIVSLYHKVETESNDKETIHCLRLLSDDLSEARRLFDLGLSKMKDQQTKLDKSLSKE